ALRSTATPPCTSVMSVKSGGQQGGMGETFADFAQLQEGGLRCREPLLLGAALADLDRPFEATQAAACGGHVSRLTRAVIPPHDAGADPFVVVVSPFLASLYPRHVLLRG